MVSAASPGSKSRAASPLDPADARRLLEKLAKENRAALFARWSTWLASAKDLQSEIDATVAPLQVFFNKWVVEILVVLALGNVVRFNDLKRSLSGVSGRTLSQRLRDLEAQGLVKREVFDEMPVRVEYSLTKRGWEVASLALPLVLYLRLGSEA